MYILNLVISFFVCPLGIHKWEIHKWVRFADKKCRHISAEGFDRTCVFCNKEQILKKPKKFHPTKYVWTNLNINKNNKGETNE